MAPFYAKGEKWFKSAILQVYLERKGAISLFHLVGSTAFAFGEQHDQGSRYELTS